MRWLILLVRASALLLCASAGLKALDLSETSGAFAHYGVPASLAPTAVVMLCIVELVLGLWGFLSPAAAAPALMLVFTSFAGWHVAMGVLGSEEPCPCMGFSVFGARGPQMVLAPILALFAVSNFVVVLRTRPTADNPPSPDPSDSPGSAPPL